MPPSPVTGRVFPGRTDPLTLLATGGLLAGVRGVTTLAVGKLPLLLAELGSGVADVLLAVLVTLGPVVGAKKLIVLATVAALAKLATSSNVTIPVTEL